MSLAILAHAASVRCMSPAPEMSAYPTCMSSSPSPSARSMSPPLSPQQACSVAVNPMSIAMLLGDYDDENKRRSCPPQSSTSFQNTSPKLAETIKIRYQSKLHYHRPRSMPAIPSIKCASSSSASSTTANSEKEMVRANAVLPALLLAAGSAFGQAFDLFRTYFTELPQCARLAITSAAVLPLSQLSSACRSLDVSLLKYLDQAASRCKSLSNNDLNQLQNKVFPTCDMIPVLHN
ncbi:hypothetical protein HDU82_000231 [Entophlyctis luteolus]|nr:hypothetical protein HDU82_000231 [Entophlyctis luteolus]